MENVLEYLETAAALYPEKTAVADRHARFTFRQLRACARKLAAAPQLQTGSDRAIGVFTSREVSTIVLFFAAVYSGNYYVPIDPQLPAAKMQSIVDDANIQVILGTEDSRGALEKLTTTVAFLTPDLTAEDASLEPVTFAPAKDKPLYMIYTSGSTGKPKGVLKSHGSMISFVEAFSRRFGFDETEIIGNQTPFSFDASAKDVYLMLKTGATMEIIPTELFMMPPSLIRYLNERQVTYICWVPTALSIVTQLNTFMEVLPETLKRVFFVGEAMPMKQLNKWRKALPDLQYVNLYGSSEIAGVSCYYEVQGTFSDQSALPMGKAMPNCRIYLADNGSLVTKPGQIGEIYYASDALALEYYNDPEKTASCFALRDFGNGMERTFRSGDLAQYDENGDLVFASRNDFQIKHMGHRIELGEIETVAGSLAEIDRCCCLYNKEKMKITLFCQLAKGCEKNGREIQSLLRPLLTSYMLPSKVIILPQLPLNANGKIDRQALMGQLLR